jgi:hypothetical protein
VLSRASARERGGRMLGSLLANMVFPAPGGPMRIRMGNYYSVSNISYL